jgi:hypothetical protein
VLAATGPLGFRVLVTDAKDDRAKRLYERRGMIRLTRDGWHCRMVLDLKPLVAVRD